MFIRRSIQTGSRFISVMAQSMTPMEDALRAKGSHDLGLGPATPDSPDLLYIRTN